jgi:serine protease AprX
MEVPRNMTIPARMRARTRWLAAAGALALLAHAGPAAAATRLSPDMARLAARAPQAGARVIVQFDAPLSRQAAERLVARAGGRNTTPIPLIHGMATSLPARAAAKLARRPGVRAVSLNARVKPQAARSTTTTSTPTPTTSSTGYFPVNAAKLLSAYPSSANASQLWAFAPPLTGRGVTVAVIDTGIAGNMPDFKKPDGTSRVLESVVTNPSATTAEDRYGHGTHVAGIIAGNGYGRDSTDKQYGQYLGVAPDANLVSIKAGDDAGNATVLDVIYGLQFAVDHKADYNIRVVNLSLESAQAQSYLTDPLDAAVEAAWNSGIVVVAAAGNRGTAADAVSYAPGNDPYAISVGGVDDAGTKATSDDDYASWSSVGTTQDGFAKPDISAPGAHIVSTLSPKSQFSTLCPSCIVGMNYIRAGGTSMAAPVVAGVAALMLQRTPSLTPDDVKTILMRTTRNLSTGVDEVNASGATSTTSAPDDVNAGLTPSTLLDSVSGQIDPTRSTWSRSTWSTAPSGLTAGWARSSWACTCSKTTTGAIDPTRSTWSRSTWSTAWTF